MMDCHQLPYRIQKFPNRYFLNFDYIWRWKIETDAKNPSILDAKHINETYRRLTKILPKWQTYRNGENSDPLSTLRDSLQNISDSYNQICEYSLLKFEEIPEKSLEHIWHELGRVKEFEGKKNERGYYYVIAVCKPLLLIWGQTPAFDSKVRKNLPGKYGISNYKFKITFHEWYELMTKISRELINNNDCVKLINDLNYERYGVSNPVPYGRYLDIYYWIDR